MKQLLRALACSAVAALACGVFVPAAEAGWLPPVNISEASESAGLPHVVLDSGGNATAVWERWNGADIIVESAYRPAGEEWEAPVNISAVPPEEAEPGAFNASSPQVAVDGAGDVTVIWERYAGVKLLLQVVERPAGGEWGAPVTIGEVNLGPSPEPWIAADSAGDALAVWKHGEVVESAFHPAAGEWEAPVPISPEESFVPQAAMNAAGDATVVWMHFDGSDYVVESAFLPGGGEWEAPTLVSEPGESAGNPHIALDAAGNTLVAWRGESEGDEYVRTSYRPVEGEWEAPTNASAKGEQVQSIRDAVDPAGDAIVAWAGSGGEVGEFDRVRTAYRPAEGEWEAPVTLSANGGNGFPSDVVFDTGGNAAIIWQRSAESSNIVEAAYRPAAGEWEFAVGLSEEGKQAFDAVVVLDAPGVMALADGDATAVWVSEESHPCGEKSCRVDTVQAAGYDPGGLPSLALEFPSVAEVGEPVAISVSGEGVYSPLIDFGDGDSVADSEANHSYDAPGEYEVSAAGAEILGYKASSRRTITIVPGGTLPDPEGGEPGDPGSGGGSDPPGGEPVASHDPPSSGPSAACSAARARLRSAKAGLARISAKQRGGGAGALSRHLAAAKHRQRALVRRALRQAAGAC
jgi:hypothetical protein